MAVTEQTRYNVHKHFEETMGQELAATLMEMLPGVGWGDVARKSDIDRLEVAVKSDIDRLEQRIDALERRMDRHFYAGIGLTCTIVGLVGAAARLL